MRRFSSGRMNVFDGEHFEVETFDEMEFEETPETLTIFAPTDMVNLSRIPDEYDYDMETSHNTFFWDELLPTLIVYCLTFVLGLVGNVLIIFTIFRYRKMKSTTNVFLASLASSDLLLILFCIPVKDLKKAETFSVLEFHNPEKSAFSSHRQTNLFMKNNVKEVKFVHRLDNEFSMPLNSNSTVTVRLNSKTMIFEPDKQNGTETENLSLVEKSLLNSNLNLHLGFEIEGLMSKLSKEIKKCSELVKKLNQSTKVNFEGKKMVKSSTSDSKILKWKAECNKKECEGEGKDLQYAINPVFAYLLWKKTSKTSEDELVRRKKSSDKKKKCDLKPVPLKCLNIDERSTVSTDSTKCRKKNSRQKKCFCKKQIWNTREFFCCQNCVDLKKRIVCLEMEVQQIKQKISCYNSKNEEGETCQTSNFRSPDACERHHHYCQEQQQQTVYFPSTTSSFTAIVHESKNRDLHLKSSTSDCHLNVGMEITMENVDPDTGKRLDGETNRDFQQNGNIQCRLFEEGQAPLLLMNTDFEYNPLTGMLFKINESSKATSQSTSVALPLKSSQQQTSNSICKGFSKSRDLQALNCMRGTLKKEKKKNCDSRKCMSLEQNHLDRFDENQNCKRSVFHCHKSKKSQSFELYRNDISEEQCPKTAKEELKKDVITNEIIPESKLEQDSKCHSAKGKSSKKFKNGKSQIPTRKNTTPSLMGRSASETSSISVAVSTLSSTPESYPPEFSKERLAKLFSFTWTFGFFLCKLVHYMQSVSAICSVLTLTAMSLERYYAIVHPMKAQYICTISQARRIITGTWVSAFLLAVPILFAQVHLKVGVKVEAYWCVRDWDNKIVWRAHELYMLLLILVVPTGVMAVAYTAICWEIWEVMQRRQDMTSGKEQGFFKKPVRNSSTESFPSFAYTDNPSKIGSKRRGRALLKKELTDDASSVKQVIKMLVAVIVIYVLCWGPMLIDNVLQAYGVLSHIRMGWLKYMGTAFHLMAYFNSCINPIIYGFMSKNFRDSFRKTLCCMGKRQKTALRSFSLSQTRNTSIRYAESSFGKTVSIALPV